jgi:hypothetical protein
METSANEPTISAIADRLRTVFVNRPGGHEHTLSQLGEELGAPVARIQALLRDRNALIDPVLLIDLVAVAVRDDAVDPHWLLTGDYDLDTHHCALALVEEQGSRSVVDSALRTFVTREWTSLQMSLTPPLQFSRAT